MSNNESRRPIKAKPLSHWLAELVDVAIECERALDDIFLDSRDCTGNSAFIALDGEHHRATEFIDAAVAAGSRVVLKASQSVASAELVRSADDIEYTLVKLPDLAVILAELAADFYDRPGESMALVAITGTNGKTSVSHYAAQLSSFCGIPAGVIGTLGYGIEGHLRPTRNTTPDAVSVQRQLAELHSAGAQVVYLEASSHALVQGRLAALPLDIALLTNLTRDHLDYHGSQADYARAKFSLFERFDLIATILNDDDYYGSLWRHELAAPASPTAIMAYSLLHSASFSASDVALDPDGMRCTINIDGKNRHVRLNLLGEFNLSNVLAACACVYSVMINRLDGKTAGKELPEKMLSVESGECAERILAHCGQLRAVPGRLQLVDGRRQKGAGKNAVEASGCPVVIDYAHTPDALQKTLASLKQHGFGTIVTVLGCGGDRDKGKRALMGEIASLHSSSIVLTSDNPRREDPFSIIRDIQSGTGTGNALVTVIEQRDQAIASAIGLAGPDTLVLVAGKGHEDYQDYAGVRYPFSDLEVVKRALASGEGGLSQTSTLASSTTAPIGSKASSGGRS